MKKAKKSTSLKLFFTGCFMGFSDLIPGISGGTIAFIFGIYKEFLESIKSFDGKALLLLFTLKFDAFQKRVSLRPLLLILGGMATAILSFAKVLEWLLRDPLFSVYLYAFFFGLIIGSLQLLQTQVIKWKTKNMIMLLTGLIASFLITHYLHTPDSLFSGSSFWNARIIFGGFLAISAMLLPGISGSFILLLLGLYQPTIKALSELSGSSLVFLTNLGFGILLGLFTFSRVVLFAFKKKKSATIALLMGFMMGSVPAIWPYQKGGHLQNKEIVISIFFLIAGYFLCTLLQRKHEKKKHSLVD